MTERTKKRTLYDPFNPPGATRLHVFTPAVTVPPRSFAPPGVATPASLGAATPAAVPSATAAAAPAATPVAAPTSSAGVGSPATGDNSILAPWQPVAFAAADSQSVRTSIPMGPVPDKIELALHPPGAKPQNTFTLG